MGVKVIHTQSNKNLRVSIQKESRRNCCNSPAARRVPKNADSICEQSNREAPGTQEKNISEFQNQEVPHANSRWTILSNEQRYFLLWPETNPTGCVQLPGLLRRAEGRMLAQHEDHRPPLRLLWKRSMRNAPNPRTTRIEVRIKTNLIFSRLPAIVFFSVRIYYYSTFFCKTLYLIQIIGFFTSGSNKFNKKMLF